jgi:iron complex outermembrane receptor protein
LISNDYEYLGIISKVAGWTFDNKVYTYGYYHDGYNGLDPGGVLATEVTLG